MEQPPRPERPPPLPQLLLRVHSVLLALQVLFHASDQDLQDALEWLRTARPADGEYFGNLVETVIWWRRRVQRSQMQQRQNH